jgi:RNA polymerase sigma factor (sigma-70 family)
MNMKIPTPSKLSDEQLWRLSREGNREAFGNIVARYQGLICSLAFSACGSLPTSEDLAQETFIAAWRRLDDLREPGKLRHWLCGIVRNLAANAVRRDLRHGGTPASLETVADEASPDDDPAVQAAKREEETLLWRTLASLPESYREPMVLFYRENQSVAEVASGLDLSEEVVRQRLSRGRAMLREEMAAVVESTLTRTRPTPAFTAGVLAALPLVSTPTAKAAAAAVGGKAVAGASKGVLGSVGLGAIFGPVIGLFVGLFSTKAAASTARSQPERVCITRYARRIVLFCWVMSIVLVLILSQAGKLFPASPVWVVCGVFAWMAALVLTILWTTFRVHVEVMRIRAETATEHAVCSTTLTAHGLSLSGPRHYESRWKFLGLPLFAFATDGTDTGLVRSRMARGWIACGDHALSPLLAVGGVAIGPIAIGAVTVGLVSLSLWGCAVGVLAAGSVAMGWLAFGVAAVGWKAAGGGAALAHDYAVGVWVRAAEANTAAAKEWFQSQGIVDGVTFYFSHVHWIVLLAAVAAFGMKAHRSWKLRRLSR